MLNLLQICFVLLWERLHFVSFRQLSNWHYWIFNSTSRYLDDLLKIVNPCFGQMVGQIYPAGLRLNGTKSSGAGAPFLDLNLSITNGVLSSNIYGKRGDFTFEIVNFPFLEGDVPRSPSCGVYVSQLFRFARVFSNVDDVNNRNLVLTTKLLKQGYRYHYIRRTFSKLCHWRSGLVVGCSVGLKTLLQQGISERIFYGDLVYKFESWSMQLHIAENDSQPTISQNRLDGICL